MTIEHTSDGYVKTWKEGTTPDDYKNNLWFAVLKIFGQQCILRPI